MKKNGICKAMEKVYTDIVKQKHKSVLALQHECHFLEKRNAHDGKNMHHPQPIPKKKYVVWVHGLMFVS